MQHSRLCTFDDAEPNPTTPSIGAKTTIAGYRRRRRRRRHQRSIAQLSQSINVFHYAFAVRPPTVQRRMYPGASVLHSHGILPLRAAASDPGPGRHGYRFAATVGVLVAADRTRHAVSPLA